MDEPMKSNNKKKIREFLRLERMISKVMREVSKNEDKLRNSKEKMRQPKKY